MSFTEKHLRATILRENVIGFIKDFKVAFNPIELVCGFEKKTEDNPHVHMYVKYHNDGPTKQKISEFMKKQPLVKNSKYSGSYYHKEQFKTKEANIIYTIKDGDIMESNIDLKEYIEKSKLIDENKKLSSKEKLYNMYINKFGLIFPSSKYNLFVFIDDIYVNEWNKSPLAMSHMGCYARYIITKIYKEIKDKEQFDLLMKDIYGIKIDYETYNNNIIKMRNEAFLEIEERAQALYDNN